MILEISLFPSSSLSFVCVFIILLFIAGVDANGRHFQHLRMLDRMPLAEPL